MIYPVTISLHSCLLLPVIIWKISAYDAHMQEQQISNYDMSDFSKKQEMTEK